MDEWKKLYQNIKHAINDSQLEVGLKLYVDKKYSNGATLVDTFSAEMQSL